MKLAIAQFNCKVGDLEGNAARILEQAHLAREQGATLLLTPELSLCGYSPEDLLLRDGFEHACDVVLVDLARQIHGITVVVGHPETDGLKRYNAASVLRDGAIIATYYKHELPNDTVFDEERYFEHGELPCVFEQDGIKFGIAICADVWEGQAAMRTRRAGADVLLILNASPYHVDKQHLRHEIMRKRAKETGLVMVYANQLGGLDELIFDGASFVMDEEGSVVHQLPHFEESLRVIEFDQGKPVPGEVEPVPAPEASIYQALCLGVRDYIQKNGFNGVLIGLSGGIDSALTLAVAVDALGADNVRAVMMPSPYTSQMSLDDAQAMAANLNVQYDILDIQPAMEAYLNTLGAQFEGLPSDTTEENLQARIRGNLLMALSNKTGALVLTTGNKSEMAVGYSTLYGDMAGGLAVLKDVRKTWVYRLSHYRNGLGSVIPERIITRPPSAELRPDQTDQDSLPPYDVLDSILAHYVEQDLTVKAIVEKGFDEAVVRRVVRLIHLAEYKRRQSPIGLRITNRGFGKDWRYPVTVNIQPNF